LKAEFEIDWLNRQTHAKIVFSLISSTVGVKASAGLAQNT
jgi:hypothetical protein